MEKIPAELCFQIAGDLPKVDLKSLRLALKHFYSVSTTLLFNRVYASLHLKDLEVLSAISRHPIMSVAVQEIVYLGLFFQPLRPAEKLPKCSRQYYDARREEDEATMREGKDVAIISEALARMPNIRTVILTNHWLPTRNLLGDCHPSLRSMKIYPNDERLGGPLAREYPPFAKKPSGGPLVRHDGVNIDPSFRVMCHAISIADLPVQAFSVDYRVQIEPGRPRRGLCPATFHLEPDELEYCRHAFRHLRKISFSLTHPDYFSDSVIPQLEWNSLQEGNIAKIFAAATELEELTFDFTDFFLPGTFLDLRSDEVYVPLEKYLGTHTWHRLRSIGLFSKELQPADLLALLHRHRKTLKHLSLEGITLHDGSWEKVAEEVRQWLILESAHFSSLRERWDEEDHGLLPKSIYDNELEKYMLYGKSGSIYPE
ncbi:hypothetical protein F4821DRAFT_264800 [Hypoxylon rubiginosum]|uniref:Uncharacterized protein n=1 Tax=Hypoxylon rubiginosum TaxID=110542 RepID=A0ACC0CME8_9PEZI|nr:hypothetical protein F4821DRAFT_264800 [Hypoxylon rubiginosum]